MHIFDMLELQYYEDIIDMYGTEGTLSLLWWFRHDLSNLIRFL